MTKRFLSSIFFLYSVALLETGSLLHSPFDEEQQILKASLNTHLLLHQDSRLRCCFVFLYIFST